MNVIIIGCGRVGRTLAQKLNEDGNAVTVIDSDAGKVKRVTDRYDVMGVVGNGATHTLQEEAGIASADLMIAVTASDELNLLCSLVAKKASDCQTIARVKNPVYSVETPYLKDELGLAMVINPEYEAAEEIARVLRFPSALKIEPFAKGKAELIKFKLPKGNEIIGMSVKEVFMKYNSDLLICTIEREDESYIANGDFVFEEKDVISIMATPKNAYEFFANIKCKGHSVKNALIVGGGTITHYLCQILEKSGISLTVIEKDMKRCEELSTQWPKVKVIHGDGTDHDLLIEEGVEGAGAFVALSDSDEENVLMSLFAKGEGCEKTVTKVNRTDYDSLLSSLELDASVCPRIMTSDKILRYVRAMENTVGSNVETLYNIIPGEVEAAEFFVRENSPIVGVPLCKLKFKKDVLIASICRDKQTIVPRGNDTIEAGDFVVVVSKHMGLYDIADVLK